MKLSSSDEFINNLINLISSTINNDWTVSVKLPNIPTGSMFLVKLWKPYRNSIFISRCSKHSSKNLSGQPSSRSIL